MKKRIVVIGGGFAGAHLAKSLDKTADVTLIEPRSHFVHAPAMIRALVQPVLVDRALIPYANLLANGAVVQARVTSVNENSVTLADGRKLDADYVVLATGSSNTLPFKPSSDNIVSFRTDIAAAHERIRAAQSIAIIGAGAVGTELAGEIAHYMPEKSVSLVSSDVTLFPDMPPKLGRDIEAKLTDAGVAVIKGTRATNLEQMDTPYAGRVTLDNGANIAADLIFPTIGSRPTTKLFDTLPGTKHSPSGRVKADGWMRPSDLPNVFALGDAVDLGDRMTIVAVSRQVPWLVKALTALSAGKPIESIKPYTPWNKAPILLPLGPRVGASFMVLFTAGNALTRAMKGKDLFLTKYNKMLRRV